MAKNVTLRLSDALLKECKHLAVEEDKSLSCWVADLLKTTLQKRQQFRLAKKNALKFLNQGLQLDGTPLSRDESHER